MSNNPLNTISFDEAIAARGGFSGAINVPKQAPLFTYPNGRSLMFYIPPKDPQRNKFKSAIISNGGIIVDNKPVDLHNNSDILILSTKPILDVLQDDRIYNINFDFILNSLENGELENLDDYRYKLNTQETVIADGPGQVPVESQPVSDILTGASVRGSSAGANNGISIGGRGHNRFTADKDDFILQQIRLNPKLRHSHRFFQELSQEPILKGHTGNSIRSRYRKHLEKKLIWVYKYDENSKLVKDNDGNPVKLGIDELPDTLKNKYTPQDDYLLCIEALAYINELITGNNENVDITKKIALPYSFFNDMFKKNSKHSLHSWRDRYRKFITDGSLQSYITYYESCLANNAIPRPLVRVNEFTKSVQDFRTLLKPTNDTIISDSTVSTTGGESSNKAGGLPPLNRKRKLEDSIPVPGSALDEEIGELKSSNIDASLFVKTAGDDSRKQAQAQARQARQQQQDRAVAAVVAAAAAAATVEGGAAVEEESQDILKPIPIPKLTSHLDEDDDDEDEEDDGDEVDEIEDIETDNLNSSNQTHSQSEAPFAQSTQLQSQQAHAGPSQYDTAPAGPSSQVIDSQASQVVPFQLEYLNFENLSINDILLDKAITLLENSEFLNKVNEVTAVNYEDGQETGEDLADLVVALESLGLSDRFLSHIIYSCNADKLTIRFYLEIYISNFQKYLQSKNDEIHFYETFNINHGEGIWNSRMDSFLHTANEDKLLEIHSKSQVRNRKAFLQQIRQHLGLM